VATTVNPCKERGSGYLEFLEVGFRVVNQSEASRLSATELSTETECLNSFFGGFVEGCKTGANFIFGKICLGGMEDINDLKKLALSYEEMVQIACG
jgi:hypothetical protein